MKLGKLDLKTWTYNGLPLHNPIRLLWNIIMLPVYITVLFLFCIVVFLVTLDFRDCVDTWKENSIF